MTPEAMHTTWMTYSKVWTDLPPAERAVLMRETLAQEVSYAGPDNSGSGIETFTAVLESFQRQFPGAWFQTSQFIAHHDQALAQWTMHGPDSAVLLTGSTCIGFNDQGLIDRLTGFWQE